MKPPPGSRPVLPSRGIHLLWLLLSGLLSVGTLAYLLWAESRTLLDWNGLWVVWSYSLVLGVVCLGIGLIQRKRWHLKRAALQEYERMLASLYTEL
jgi:hypothetical protein